jgi:hypothetical protein
MALARQQMGQNGDLSPIITSLQLSEHGSTVTLDFSVPSEAIDALPMVHKAMRGRDGARPDAQRQPVPPPAGGAKPGAPPL